MVEIVERIGRFTSSNIWKLTTVGTRKMTESELKEHKKQNPKSMKKNIDDGFGAPALTYIEEKRAERTLGRSLDLGKGSSSTLWGKVIEYYCHKFELGYEYSLVSKKTIVHPKYNFWSGTPDFRKPKTTGDIKCNEPKRHFELTMNLLKVKSGLITLNEFKELEKEVYWQVVSNCILDNNPFGEIVSYTPTHEQLLLIRDDWEVDNYVSGLNKTLSEHLEVDFQAFHYLINKPDHNLSYIPNFSKFPNCEKFEFEVPIEDKIYLAKRVIDANKLLNELIEKK